MPQTNEGILLFIGAIFFLIGLFGGRLEVAPIKIRSSLGKFPRIVSSCIGIIFMGLAVSRLIFPSFLPQPTVTPAGVETPTPVSTLVAIAPTETSAPPTNTPVPEPTNTPEPTNMLKPTNTSQPPTITPTSRPTNTPRPTPTPTATMDADPTVYDNFNNPVFDGKWNPQLWGFFGDPTHIEQKDGVLLISRKTPGDGGLIYAKKFDLSTEEINFIEAKIMLSSIESSSGLVGIVLMGPVDSGGWLNCDIGNASPDMARASCRSQDYSTDGITVPYNSWHTMRMEINSSTAILTFFIDDAQIGSYVHKNPEAFRKGKFNIQLDSWSKGSGSVTGYIDDVRIGRPEQ